MRTFRALFLASSLVSPALALAQTAPPPPPKHEETFEAQYVGVDGNASSNTFGLGADIIARPGTWLFRHKLSFVRNESKDVLTAKAFDYKARAEKAINARTSAFGEYEFFRDRFAGVVRRNSVVGGLALKVVNTASQTFAVDAGLGYLNERRLTGANISSGSYLAGWGYKVKLSGTAELTDDLHFAGVFSQSDNWRLDHAIALTAKLTSGLSLKVSNGIRYANFPAPGFKKTDSITAIALVAKFAH